MMKYLPGSILLLILISFEAFAQSDITITDHKNFVLQTVDTNGSIKIGGDIKVELIGIFESKNNSYKIIKVDSDTIFLRSPLNKTEFRNNLASKWNKDASNVKIFSEYSIEQIFLWIYSLRQDDLGPIIGRLNLGSLTQPFKNSGNNDSTRIRLLDSVNSRHMQLNDLVSAYKEKVLLNVSKSLEIIKGNRISFGVDTLSLSDTLALKSLRNVFETESYPSIDSIHRADLDTLQAKLIRLGSSPSISSLNKQIFSIKQLDTSYQFARRQIINLKASMAQTGIYPIEKISLQFERGYLERIQVWVRNKVGSLDIYENIYAIGFSSVVNLKSFQSVRLFIRNSAHLSAGIHGSIFLSDALGNYDNLLDLYTRDYSPADTTINEINPENGPIILQKERYTRLFDSKIYSDLQGVSAEEPNGLVQIEVSRRFNFNTVRGQIGSSRSDYCYFTFLNLYGALSKIENKLKYLTLRNENTVVNNVITSPSYVSNLDLRRYENASLGVDLNCFLFDYPDGKITNFVNFDLRYGHVRMIDSVFTVSNGLATKTNEARIFSGHTVTFGFPKISLEIFSERRVGFNVAYSFNHTYAFTNNRFKQIMSYAKSDLNAIPTESPARHSHMAEVYVRIETSRDGNGQLFGRARFFWQKGDANTFFNQLQVGYAYNIIFRR